MSDIAYTTFSAEPTLEESSNVYRELNFVFAKIVDGDIAEALVILGSN